MLLATHDLEQVFTLADRIVVLRDGAVVADVSPVEVQRSDVVALMSGVEVDSIASRQIRRLQSLADQLSEAEPAASLPLIVSAMAGALEVDMLCVHLLETTGDRPVLRRLAATGLPAELLELNAALPVGAEGGPAGLAAAGGAVVVVDDLQTRSTWPAGTAAAAASGVRSAWAAPILGSDGVLGTVSGYAASPGNPASGAARAGHHLPALRGVRHRAGAAAHRGVPAQPGAGITARAAGEPGRAGTAAGRPGDLAAGPGGRAGRGHRGGDGRQRRGRRVPERGRAERSRRAARAPHRRRGRAVRRARGDRRRG